jgi:hypothetical protein
MINLLNLAMLIRIKTNSTDLSEFEILKERANNITDEYILNSNLTDLTKNDSLIIGNSIFSSQMYLSNGDETLIQERTFNNNFAFFDMKECEKVLRDHYNITQSTPIIYITNNFDSALSSNNSNTFSITAYNSENKQKLNIDLCKDVKQTIMLPIKNMTGLNLTLYKEMKEVGVDIFNASDPYFNDRCISLTENDTLVTTIGLRREKYLQPLAPECNGYNCTYNSITNNNSYVECSCGLKKNDIFYVLPVGYLVDSLSKFNFDVVKCPALIPVFNYLK